MTIDYQVLTSLPSEKLPEWVFRQYEGKIRKKAFFYERVSKGRIDSSDFISETYLNLLHFLRYIRIEKANPDKFMFYIYVTYAISKTFKKMYKEIQTSVLDSVSLEKEHSSFSAEEDFFHTYTKKHLYKNLSSRQVQILELRQKHPELTYAEIGKRFGVRGPTIVRDVQLAKETYNKLFGTNFQIGRQKQNV